MHTDFLVGTAFYMRFRDWQNRRYTHCARENKNLRLAGPTQGYSQLPAEDSRHRMREARSEESSARPARATGRTARPCWMTGADFSASQNRLLADSAWIALAKLAESQPKIPANAPAQRCSCSSWSERF